MPGIRVAHCPEIARQDRMPDEPSKVSPSYAEGFRNGLAVAALPGIASAPRHVLWEETCRLWGHTLYALTGAFLP